MQRFIHAIVVLLAAAHLGAAADIDSPPIRYATAEPANAVGDLEQRLKTGKVKLKVDEKFGYLPSLLAAMDVPKSSQVLVFSRTSFQRSRIGPKTPRAIYFSDDVTIGYCQKGDVLEIAAADANLGTVFYSLSQRPDRPVQFTRQTERCLLCHGPSRNQGFPGHLIRSVSPDARGETVLTRGSKTVDHSTPIEDRWGGWYVTGTSGKQEHMGNQIVGGWPGLGEDAGGANTTDLKRFFAVEDYLTPHSDLVALMVLEHQGEAYNHLTRANFQTRLALHDQAEASQSSGKPPSARSEILTTRVHTACEPLVKYLLFCDEARLTEPVAGTSRFAKEFVARGPFDSQKRSLREFDLKTRMFRYPLSYIIYSRQFDGLPIVAKERVYLRLWEVLSGKDTSQAFAHLSNDDRRAILEIVRETKPGLPAYWK